jgi:hypothetical protein
LDSAVQEIQRWQRQQAEALGYEWAETAAVFFCQRFGSSLHLNIHWHITAPDASSYRMPRASAPTRGNIARRPASTWKRS